MCLLQTQILTTLLGFCRSPWQDHRNALQFHLLVEQHHAVYFRPRNFLEMDFETNRDMKSFRVRTQTPREAPLRERLSFKGNLAGMSLGRDDSFRIDLVCCKLSTLGTAE